MNDTARLDWVAQHPGFNYDFDWQSGKHWITAWVSTPDYSKAHCHAAGTSFRDCIDQFLKGNVTRID